MGQEIINRALTYVRHFLTARALAVVVAILLLVGVLTYASAPGPRSGMLTDDYAYGWRLLGLTPVFPPREDFNVGDVIHVSYDANDPDNLDKYTRTWLGSLNSVRELSKNYLATRTKFLVEQKNVGAADQSGSSAIEFSSLPVVALAARQQTANSSAATGIFGFLQSFGISAGRKETQYVDFGDTRAFGLPDGGIAVDGQYEKEFRDQICGRTLELFLAKDMWGQLVRHAGGGTISACPEGMTCLVMIVTRTILTKSLNILQTSAKSGRGSLNLLRGDDEEKAETIASGANLEVNIVLGPESDPSDIDDIVVELAKAVEGQKIKDQESTNFSVVGASSNLLQLRREYQRPVIVAFDALAGPADFFQDQICEAGRGNIEEPADVEPVVEEPIFVETPHDTDQQTPEVTLIE